VASTAEPIARLIQALGKLPGMGPKSAQRLAYHLLLSPDAEIEELATSLLSLKGSLVFCSRCFNIADRDPCSICVDSQRDRSKASITCCTALCARHGVSVRMTSRSVSLCRDYAVVR